MFDMQNLPKYVRHIITKIFPKNVRHIKIYQSMFDISKFTKECSTSIYKFGLSVCLYQINVKTAEPIGPKFFVGHLGTPGKVYEKSKFQIFVSIKIRSSLNFLKF